MSIKHPVVIGVGGVGSLVATLLSEMGMQVVGVDRQRNPNLPSNIECITGDVTDRAFLEQVLAKADAVVCCLPYHLTLTVARAAHQAGVHYFDATEDVESTSAIRKLAKNARAAMVPQNGLAPGFIGICGAHLANQFDKDNKMRHIKMRVGALPQNPIGQLGYAGNWSLEGLVHEYIAECDVIADSKAQKVPALRNPEIIRIDGVEYEAFTTSGGLGTMTETYAGRVETLNYKSIRYPGHLDGMKLLLEEMRFREDPDELVKRIANALPPDDSDRVLIHCSVQGHIGGKLQTKELVMDYKPIELGGKMRTAIAWTTASSIVAVVELLSNGTLPQKGFVKQEDIPLHAFLKTATGKLYAEHCPGIV